MAARKTGSYPERQARNQMTGKKLMIGSKPLEAGRAAEVWRGWRGPPFLNSDNVVFSIPPLRGLAPDLGPPPTHVPKDVPPALKKACQVVLKHKKVMWPHGFTAMHLAAREGSDYICN